MRDIGRIDRPPGPVLAWRSWQLGLVAIGVVLGVALIGGEFETRDSDPARPPTPIAEEDLGAPVWSLVRVGGSILASTTRGDLWLKDPASGRVLGLRDLFGRLPLAVAPSPDGRILAIAGGQADARIWDVARAAELEPLRDGTGAVRALAFSPGGTMLAVGGGMPRARRGVVALWAWPGRRRLATLETHRAGVNALAFSPDGSRLAAVDPVGGLTIWDVPAGTLRARVAAHPSAITAMASSPDGRLIATSSFADGAVRLWDARTGEPRGSLPDARTAVTAMAFSPDGSRLAVAQGDGTASLWDVETGRRAGMLRAATGRLQAVAFLDDGDVLGTGGIDGSVRFWDVARIPGVEPGRP